MYRSDIKYRRLAKIIRARHSKSSITKSENKHRYDYIGDMLVATATPRTRS